MVVLGFSFLAKAYGETTSDSPKIAVVDLKKCIHESLAGKAAKKRIQALTQSIKQEVEKRKKHLKKMEDEFQKQSMVLSLDAKRDKEKELLREREDLRDFIRRKERELQEADIRETRPIMKAVLDIAREIGKTRGISIILEAKTLIYFDPAIDITDEVLKKYDARFKASKNTNTTKDNKGKK